MKVKKDIIVSNNSLVAELREVRWLNNPVIYSQVSGDFSPMQQRILIGIIDLLQPQINACIDEHSQTGEWRDITFEDDSENDKTLDIRLDPRALGVAPDAYRELEEAAEQLADKTMKFPVYNRKGKIHHYAKAALFARVDMPAKATNSGSMPYKEGHVRVVMLKENIKDFLHLNQGYTQHVARIAQIARIKRTPRLYIYFSRYRDSGHKIVPYKDLCEFLGLTDEYYMVEKPKKRRNTDGTEVIEMEKPKENPFSKFTKVRKLVLDPSKVEMDQLMKSGEIDFTFDYEPLYDNDRKRGNPSSLLFSFTKGPLGEYHDVVLRRSAQERTLIGWFIKHCPDLKNTELISIIIKIDNLQWEQFRQYAYTTVELMEKADADNGAAYILALLNNWTPSADPILNKVETLSEENHEENHSGASWLDRFGNPTKRIGQQAWNQMCADCTATSSSDTFSLLTVDKIENKQIFLSGKEKDIQAVEHLIMSSGTSGQQWLKQKLMQYAQMEINGIQYRIIS